jgi:hypothetical protein
LRWQWAERRVAAAVVTARKRCSEHAVAPAGPARATPAVAAAPAANAKSVRDSEQFVVAWVSAELKIDPASIDPHRSFFDYGVDSVTTVMLVVALEE